MDTCSCIYFYAAQRFSLGFIYFIVRSCELEEEFEIPETPLTDVTRRIEEISLCIMKENPCLLDNHLGELLVPLEIEEAISYELFASVAKSVMKKKLSCLATSVWSKAAIACFLTKEVVFSGMISEVDVCSLVDYASRFIAENAFDEINEEVVRISHSGHIFLRVVVMILKPAMEWVLHIKCTPFADLRLVKNWKG